MSVTIHKMLKITLIQTKTNNKQRLNWETKGQHKTHYQLHTQWNDWKSKKKQNKWNWFDQLSPWPSSDKVSVGYSFPNRVDLFESVKGSRMKRRCLEKMLNWRLCLSCLNSDWDQQNFSDGTKLKSTAESLLNCQEKRGKKTLPLAVFILILSFWIHSNLSQ